MPTTDPLLQGNVLLDIDGVGDLYFGEYVMNDTRREVRMYRYRAGAAALEVAYTFPAGAIRHIHGVYFDTFTGALVCLTGDNHRECRILRTEDGFRTVHTVGEGDETWRAVSVVFDEASMYYGMDAEFRSNHIYRVDRRTFERTSLTEVNGTVYFSKQVGRDLFFTTTAENGSALKAQAAAIWRISPEDGCVEMATFRKGVWHGSLFQFGTVHMPYANASADVAGVAEVETRRYTRGTDDNKETVYDADVYAVDRHVDFTADDLTLSLIHI